MKMVFIRSCVWVLVLLLVIPAGGFSQDTESAPPVFWQEELDQMLAPIALYPDPLLVQVLMASTYPLEVVQAARWVNQNPNLKDDRMAAALEEKNWDPSVKSLVNFPPVLAMMNENLEWTQNLGDAFLGQKDQVMATVQDLRAKAQAQGTLKTTPQQMVVVEEESIVIEPTDPHVVYVPVYNPTVVYGPWWYPAYPPYYYHPPGYAVVSTGFISFGVAVGLGAAWGYAWGRPNWAGRHVYVNPSQNITINRYYRDHARQNNINVSGHGHSEWRHDPVHRKGVEYRDPGLRQQFGHGGNPGAAGKDSRGFVPGGQNQMRTPGAAPGFEKHRDAGVPGSHPPGQRTNDAVHYDRSTPPQNKPSGPADSSNQRGNDVNQQREHGRGSHENVPAPQKPPQTFQGGGNLPHTGDNAVKQQFEHGRGSRENVPTPQKQPTPSFQGGGNLPNTGGNAVKQQFDRSRGGHENVPAPQKPPQTFQGGGNLPNTGGNAVKQQFDRSRGSHENAPAPQKQPPPAFQGGKAVQGGGGAPPGTHRGNKGPGSEDDTPNTGSGRHQR
jgi:hypothetical protein